MTSVFTKIVNGEIPAYKIAEDEKHLAFLDVNPVVKGHTLVIPKREVNYLFDLGNSELSELMIFAKKVAKQIESRIDCKRIAIMVLGLEVPHAHIHLLPIHTEAEVNLRNKMQVTPQELKVVQESITSGS